MQQRSKPILVRKLRAHTRRRDRSRAVRSVHIYNRLPRTSRIEQPSHKKIATEDARPSTPGSLPTLKKLCPASLSRTVFLHPPCARLKAPWGPVIDGDADSGYPVAGTQIRDFAPLHTAVGCGQGEQRRRLAFQYAWLHRHKQRETWLAF